MRPFYVIVAVLAMASSAGFVAQDWVLERDVGYGWHACFFLGLTLLAREISARPVENEDDQ